MVFVRYLDVFLVVLAAPFVLLMGGPVLGLRRRRAGRGSSAASPATAIENAAKRSKNPRTQVGVAFAVLMGRAWLMGIVILAVGIAGRSCRTV